MTDAVSTILFVIGGLASLSGLAITLFVENKSWRKRGIALLFGGWIAVPAVLPMLLRGIGGPDYTPPAFIMLPIIYLAPLFGVGMVVSMWREVDRNK